MFADFTVQTITHQKSKLKMVIRKNNYYSVQDLKVITISAIGGCPLLTEFIYIYIVLT